MSDVIGRGVIEVEVNDSGVDAGIAKIERTVANLGKVAKASGKAAADGISQIGEGGEKLAFTVDRQTKDLARSIERAAAAMQSGTKNNREYFESLANQRGANVELLKPFLAQLDQAAVKAKLAADANAKLAASTKFMDDLRTRSESIGKTAAQLAEMRAAQLGVADAAAPYIAKMRESEKATTGLNKAMDSVTGFAKTAAAALAAYFSIGAVIGKFSDSIDKLATLDDMAQKTGAAVENLSKMQKVAITFSHDMGTVDSALTKLARGMAGTDEESSKVAKALTSIGIRAKDTAGKLRDPSEVMAEIARKFQEYGDGANKAELATILFGKAGADLLPYLNDLAENMDKFKGATAGMTKQAADFQDAMGVMRTRTGELFTSVSVDLLPALNALLKAINDNRKAAEDMANEKGVRSWAEDLAEDIAFLVDKFSYGYTALKALKAESYNTLSNMAGLAKVVLPGLTMNEDTTIGDRFKVFLDNLRNGKSAKEANAAWAALGKANATAYQDAVNAALNRTGFNDRRFSGEIEINPAAKPDAPKPPSSGGDKGKELSDYEKLIKSIKEKIAIQDDELKGITELTDGEKLQAKVRADLEGGLLSLTPKQKAYVDSLLNTLTAEEKVNIARKDRRKIEQDVASYVNESAIAIADYAKQMDVEAAMYGKNTDARELAMIAIKAQTEAEKEIAKLKKIGLGPTQEETDAIRDNADARGKAAQAALAQAKANAYATQLTEDNKRFAAESILDEQNRANAILAIDSDLWRQRIANAAEGSAEQMRLQEQFDQWYANRQMAPVLDRWKTIVQNLDNDFREGFRDMLTHGQDAWKAFSKSLGNTLKTALADALYQTFIKKYVVQIVAGLAGVISGPAVAGALTGQGDSGGAASSVFQGASLLNAGKTIWQGFSGGLTTSLGNIVQSVGTAFESGTLVNIGSGIKGALSTEAGVGLGNTIGAAAPWIAGAAAVAAILVKGFSSKTVGSGILGSISGDDFSGNNYVFKRGGFLKGGSRTETSELDRSTNEAFSSAIEGMYDNFSNLGKSIGVGSNLLKDFSYEFRLALADFDDAGKQKEIQRALSIMSDSMAQAFVDSFRTSIDTAQQAASRYFTNTIDGQRSFEGGVVEQSRVASPLDPYIDDMVRIFDTFRNSVAGVEGSEGKLSAFVTQLFGLGDALVENSGYAKLFGEAIDFDKLEAAAAKGESVVDAFARLNTVFSATETVARALGKNIETAFGAVGLASTEARQRLIDVAGGLDSLASKTSFFYENFIPEEQRMETARQQVQQRLNELGYWGVMTVEKFAEEVKKLDLASEPGAKMYSDLLDVAPAFLQVANYSKQAKDAAEEQAKATQELVSAQVNAANETRRLAQEAAQTIVGDLTEGLKGLNAAEISKSLGNSLGLSEAEQGKYAQFVDYLQSATDSLAKLADLNLGDELAGYTAQVKGLIDESKRMLVAGLVPGRLRAGDARGALDAQMLVDGPQGPFDTAGKFNRATMLANAKAGVALAGMASADALNIQNVAGVMGELLAVTASSEFKFAIREQLSQGAGVPLQGVVADSIRSVMDAAVDRYITANYSPSGPGLASIGAASANLSFASESRIIGGQLTFGRDLIAFKEAVQGLDSRLSLGRISAEEYAEALKAATDLTGESIAMLNNVSEQQLRIVGAAQDLQRAGLESIGYYFGELSKSVEALNAAAAVAAAPIAKATETIGRLNSAATAFGDSAGAAIQGVQARIGALTSMLANPDQLALDGVDAGALTSNLLGAIFDKQAMMEEGSKVRNALIVSQAASFASEVITTADAARVAEQLKANDKFAGLSNAGLRDVSLLLDGISQFDATGFENAFMRLNDALAKGKINESQYQELFNLGIETFKGPNEAAKQLENTFDNLRKAARSLADSLLVDGGMSTLSPQAMIAEARRQYEATLTGARKGDADAIGNLDNVAKNLLSIVQDNASTALEYQRTFASVIGNLRDLEKITGGPAASTFKPKLPGLDADAGITPVADNRALVQALNKPAQSNDALVAEIKALRAEVIELRRVTQDSGEYTRQFAEQFDNVTEGGNAMRSEGI